MPSLSQITATFFLDLINRLGVRPAPPEAFLLSNIVQPVSIVDSGVVLTATASTAILGGPLTQGILVAPALGTLLADAGPVAAPGNFTYTFLIGSDDANPRNVVVVRRNAANNADVWAQLIGIGAGAVLGPFSMTISQLLNERVIVRVGPVNPSAGSNYQASIWLGQ